MLDGDDTAQRHDSRGMCTGKRGVIEHQLGEDIDLRQLDMRAYTLDQEFDALCRYLGEENRTKHGFARYRGEKQHKEKDNADD